MTFKTNLRNIFLVIFTTLILSACSTAKKSGDIDGDVYTGKETVKLRVNLEVHFVYDTKSGGAFCLRYSRFIVRANDFCTSMYKNS